jgi:hypothetical protein
MSQAGRFINGVIPPGGMVGSLTGNSGGAVLPDGAANINVVFDEQATTLPPSGFTFVGNAVANTLTAEQFLYSAVTIGAVSTAIFTLPLNANEAAIIYADIVAFRSDFVYSGVGLVVGGGYRQAGAAIAQVPLFENMQNNDPAGALIATFTASGNDLVIGVSGIAGFTYNWSAYVRYHIQT